MGDGLRRAIVVAAVLVAASCARRDTAPPLGTPPADAGAREPQSVAGPRYVALRTNVLSVTRAHAVSPDHYFVELRQLVIGPGKTSQPIEFRGATVILVDVGNGTAAFGDRRERLRGGTSFVVPRGAKFSFDNPGSGALLLRAITFAEE